MDWSAPLEAIRAAIVKAAKLSDIPLPSSPRAGATLRAVEWKNRRGGNRVVKGQYVNLSVFGIVAVGRDETRYDLDDPTDPDDPTTAALVPVQMGNRVVRVQLECKSDSQEPEKTATMLAERIRSRLRLPEVKAILAAQDVGYSHIEWSTDHDYMDADERMMSEAMMEIVFLKAVADRADTVPAGEGNDFITRVEGQGDLETGHDGTNLTPTFDTGEPS
jgi:hypothetical protein